MELTAEIARELLTYNPDTGKLYWNTLKKEGMPKKNPPVYQTVLLLIKVHT